MTRITLKRLLTAGAVVTGLAAGGVGTAGASTAPTVRWGAFHASHPKGGVSMVPVGNLDDASAIAAANESDLAIANGVAMAWGEGTDGELGQGDTANHFADAVPVPVPGAVQAIGEAENTDVAVTGGQPYGWGRNSDGQLCLGNSRQKLSPVEIPALSDVVQVAGGGQHMEYLLGDGTVEGCGGNANGQLCNGTTADSTVPTPLDESGLPAPVASISAGSNTTALLLTDGEVWECGDNNHGQLGDGTTSTSTVPVHVPLPGPAATVYAGGNGSANGTVISVLTDGTVEAWGSNSSGQVGVGTSSKAAVKLPHAATALPGGHTWTAAATGADTSYVLDDAGNVFAFGNDSNGQVNGVPGAKVLTPVLVLTGARMVSSTSDDAVAS